MKNDLFDDHSWLKTLPSGKKDSTHGGWDSHAHVVKKCYESHPALPVGEYVIYGGSCAYPVVTDADIYVALDFMRAPISAQPWNPPDGKLHTAFYIPDMKAPTDPAEFKRMVTWLAAQLIAGKKVHVGCVGGHGRTGTVLAALVNEMTGEADAITYVRTNYCHKAVESAAQIHFLHEHFGIKKAKPTKLGHVSTASYSGKSSSQKSGELFSVGASSATARYTSVPSNKSIWGLTNKTVGL